MSKKYCRNCGERVRHSAVRCPYCFKRIINARLVFTYIFIAVVIVTAIFLFLDYKNIEFF